jgi:hypothetical protein
MCSCGKIRIGMEITEHRNWSPDCPEHGLDSEWYRSPEQVQKREEQNARLLDLQRQAREARQRARGEIA